MACCLLAAMLFAQLVGTLQRWGAFFGIVTPPAHVKVTTLASWLRAKATTSPRRSLAIAAVAVELVAFGGWVYRAHGDHLVRLYDTTIARLNGDSPPAQLCVTAPAVTESRIAFSDRTP